ncbi:hypothetical protein TIFTF001_005173 [Ficus carica]|uniref:Uncharacterized protein n=1 Tax=Ficus carica TaxID=3494 RepID=A0AA87ZIW1_FICCA|nr:hypothetical protein TIFTF001_005173 [Ficus carica]
MSSLSKKSGDGAGGGRRSTLTLVLSLPSTIGGPRSTALRGVENDERQKLLRVMTIDS